jgi:hypothetical protein
LGEVLSSICRGCKGKWFTDKPEDAKKISKNGTGGPSPASRDGCGEGVLKGVAALHPERIVYVSCNPVTQARDVRRLSDFGYTLRRLQPLDMFPQTAHIEVVALLTWNAEGSEQNAKGDGKGPERCGGPSLPPHDFVPEDCTRG